MNTESAPVTPTEPQIIDATETVAKETTPEDTKSIDVKNFERAKEMEKEYIKRYVHAGTIENILKRNVYKEKQALVQSLQEHLNPKSGLPYTNEELLSVYLYHVIIGGSLSGNDRDGFPMDMQYDVDGGLIEKFILSLPEVPAQE